MATRSMLGTILSLVLGFTGMPLAVGWAADEGSVVEGSGFSLFDTEAIKGYDEKKVQDDPVCDRTKRPKIIKVEPDVVKPKYSSVL